MYTVRQKSSWFKHFDFVLIDLFMIQISFILAFVVRHGFVNPYQLKDYQIIGGLFVFVTICVGFFLESYKSILRRGYLEELKSVVSLLVLTWLLILAYIFGIQSTMYSRIVMMEFLMFAIPLVYGGRILYKLIARNVVKSRSKLHSMLVVTTSSRAEKLLQSFQDREYQNLRITGIVLTDCNRIGETICEIPVVATLNNVIGYCTKNVIDEVFLEVPMGEESRRTDLVSGCNEMGITVHINLVSLKNTTNSQVVEKLGDYFVLTSSINIATSRQLFCKRLMDIVGGIVGVIFTGILTIFVAPIIFLSSPGPIFFSQTRVGKNGRHFRIHKFRSMYMDAEERKAELAGMNEMNGLMFKMKDDPRVFPFGRVMRKLSIDEFPQFWNILVGNMSLVGTRPPTLDEYEKYEAHHKKRLATKPGLTGMWQTSGRSDIEDFEEVVKLDADYIANWKLGLDIKILCKTVIGIFTRKGAC